MRVPGLAQATVWGCVALIAALAASPALAASVVASDCGQPVTGPGAVTLCDVTTIATGATLWTADFTVPAPGRVEVTLTDLEWRDAFEALSFRIALPSGPLGDTITGPGTFGFDVVASDRYTALVYLMPGAEAGIGLANLSVRFNATVVPLPAPVVLLASGLALLGALRRRRGEPAGIRGQAAGA